MSFALTNWLNGMWVTVSRMNQHSENERYLRERTDKREVCYDDFIQVFTASVPLSPLDISVDVKVDGSSVGSLTVTDGSGSGQILNMDISGLSDGIHTVQVSTGKVARIYVTEDMDYLSLYADLTQEIEQTNPDPAEYQRTTYFDNLTLMLHREQILT